MKRRSFLAYLASTAALVVLPLPLPGIPAIDSARLRLARDLARATCIDEPTAMRIVGDVTAANAAVLRRYGFGEQGL